MKNLKRYVFLDCLNLMKGTIILSIISTVTTNYVDIFTATTLGNFTTSILSGSTSLVTDDIIKLALLIASSVVMIPALLLLKNTLLFKECLKHDRIVQSHFLEKEFLSTRKYSSGEISNRLEEDLIDYRFIVIDLLSAPVIILITALPLYSALSQNITYGLVCVLFSSLPIVIALISRNIETRYSLKDKEYKDNLWSKEIELISCYSYIKEKNLSAIMLQRFRNIFSLYYRNTAVPNICCTELINFLNDLSDHGSVIGVVLFGSYLLSKGEIHVGLIASYVGYMASIKAVIMIISSFVRNCKKEKLYRDRIFEFYDMREKSGSEIIYDLQSIDADGLSFSYNARDYAIKDLSFQMDNKDKLCIKGNNGSGKSTLIKVISGLYRDFTGKLIVNGIDVSKIDIHSLRQRISYIEQEPNFFKGTIRENLLLADSSKSDESLNSMLRLVNLDKSLDDIIELNSSNLSGGEKQKLSIARGLLKDSDVLIFDEPTNNLDKETKEIVRDLIKNLDKSILFISHDKDLLDTFHMYLEL